MNELGKYTHSNLDSNYTDEIDIKEILRIIRSYRKSISIIFIFTVVIVIYFTITTRPIWESTAVVMLKSGGSDPGSFVFDFGLNKI